ncbi:CBS domain-containing protein [Nitrosomonas supralitoralis]|uniref:CBS domain-containing protein n=1 Tax=Nitrosomonas supralitoralis TaxID=2116706 RepID=A0A2P7NTS5_9PROT|nr:CBS domain-containing protein [Nitrosomonas supralitoralis]PSJ16871.1 CBS domain-containing protein [Nitrosomonas supralitoralis]
MLVTDLMNKYLITIGLEDKISIVKEIFEKYNIHHLVVVESGKVLGVVSDLDLYKALSPNIGKITETLKDTATLNKRVHHIMSRNPVVLSTTATIDDVIQIFSTHSFSCIPIVDHNMKPRGIITLRDIIKALAEKKIRALNI